MILRLISACLTKASAGTGNKRQQPALCLSVDLRSHKITHADAEEHVCFCVVQGGPPTHLVEWYVEPSLNEGLVDSDGSHAAALPCRIRGDLHRGPAHVVHAFVCLISNVKDSQHLSTRAVQTGTCHMSPCQHPTCTPSAGQAHKVPPPPHNTTTTTNTHHPSSRRQWSHLRFHQARSVYTLR
jgi:hypothetical protein